jgi:peptide/nickel transport system ATP-binding protein
MPGGRRSTRADRAALLARSHPYTNGLLASIPDLDRRRPTSCRRSRALMPSPLALPPGCRFAPRCRYVEEACTLADPPLRAIGDRFTACRRDLDLTRAP